MAYNPDLDLLNPKSIGFDRLWRTTAMPSFNANQGFSFYYANIYTPTHIFTHPQNHTYILTK